MSHSTIRVIISHAFSEYMCLLVRYDTGTSDNNITCEMSTLIAERLNLGRYTIYRENPKIGNYHTLYCPYVKQYTLVG
jgi:hypothetical protein